MFEGLLKRNDVWDEAIHKKVKVFTPEYERAFESAVGEYKKSQKLKLDRKSRNIVLAKRNSRK